MKRLARYLRPYFGYAVVSPLMMMGEVIADLCLPFLMSFIVNYGIEGLDIYSAEDGSPLARGILSLFLGEGFDQAESRMSIILILGGLMLAVTLVGGLFGTLCAYTAARASQGFGHDVRCDAYAKVMSMSIEQTDRFTTGSLVTRMTNDISRLVELVETILRMLVRSPMFFIGGTVMLITLNLRFGVVLMCALPVLLVMIIAVLRRAIPLFSVVQTRLDRVNSVVQENVTGARVVKAYVREDYECERFDRANSEYKGINHRVLMLTAVLSPVMTVVLNAAVVSIIYIGGLEVSISASGMNTGTIMAAITYVTQVLSSLLMLTMMFQTISRAAASGRRVLDILESEPVVEGGALENIPEDADTAVELRSVSFSYPGTTGRPVLDSIDLKVRRGETLAVIGSTGSGKSSLAALLPRFYDATSGEVLINGKNVKEYDLGALRSRIGYVMQRTELFSDTVRNNILWGKPDATDEEVVEAAEIAQADPFIRGFAEGYDTYIAEKGASLSGGQKQRMSIARAIIRRPDILILDDSTSALDLATEARLQKALRERLADTTVIMIAQRIAGVMGADKIAVLEDDGRIIHCAQHSELMKVSATYRAIYDSQMRSGAIAKQEGGADGE